MTIVSAPTPEQSSIAHQYASNTAAGAFAAQPFPVAGHTSIAEVEVAGTAGETAMRVLFFTSDADGYPNQVAHSRVGIVPVEDGGVYTLQFPLLRLPAGQYFLCVQGENTAFRWFGEAQAGYHGDGKKFTKGAAADSADLAFRIEDTAATAHAGLRAARSGILNFGIGQMGTPASEWNVSCAHEDVDSESADIIAFLQQYFGDEAAPTMFQIGFAKNKQSGEDFVAHEGECNNATPMLPFMPRTRHLEYLSEGAVTLGEDEFIDGHGDRVLIPFASNGRIDNVNGILPVQNQPGRDPVNGNSDNHIYLTNLDTGLMWEIYKVYYYGGLPGFGVGEMSCGVVRTYDLTKDILDYPGDDCCTSANARGGAYLPFLFGPDDIVAANGGAMPHALLFTLNNNLIRADEFWGSATHNPHRTGSHSVAGNNPLHACPYGAKLRLRADFVINPAWPAAIRVILETLKLHGMVMGDGSTPGQLIGTNDKLANAGWHDANVNMNPNDFNTHGVQWSDFEVMTPTRKSSMANCNCTRTPAQPEFKTWPQ